MCVWDFVEGIYARDTEIAVVVFFSESFEWECLIRDKTCASIRGFGYIWYIYIDKGCFRKLSYAPAQWLS